MAGTTSSSSTALVPLSSLHKCIIMMQDLQSIPHGKNTSPHNVHMKLERKLVEKFHNQAKKMFEKKDH